MSTQQTAQAVTAAVAERSRLVGIASTARGKAARKAWAAVETADAEVSYRTRLHEQAVRSEMPNATEREIQAAAR